MNETILVTGGAGFLGSHVVDALIASGHRVMVLDDLSGGFEDNVHPQAEFIRGSILDHRVLDAMFRDSRIGHVYHLAAYAAEGLSHFIKRFNYQNNVIGSVNLINSAVNHGVKTFVFTSSIAVYGSNQLPMHEELIPQPEDPYGIAKLAIEQELRVTHRMFGLNYVIFRPHNVYGERQNIGDPYRNVIGIFMNQILQGKPLTIFGDGTQTRAFTYVGDIAPVIAQAHGNTRAFGQRFNIGADTTYDINTLAKTVANIMGVDARIEHLPARGEVQHAYSSHAKARRVFKCPAETHLERGLTRMAEWARRVGRRHGRPISDVEISRGLPPSWQTLITRT